MDRSFYEQSNEAACARIFKDEIDAWLLGFGGKSGVCSTLQVELWSILTTLEIAREKRCCKLIIETNSLVVEKLINDEYPSLHYALDLVQRIKNRMSEDWEVVDCHTHKEQNEVADYLAHLAQSYSMVAVF